MNTSQKRAAAVAAIAAIVVLLMMTVQTVSGSVLAAPKATCTAPGGVQYFAYAAPTGSHQFGDNQTVIVNEAKAHKPNALSDAKKAYSQSLTCDRMFTAVVAAFIANKPAPGTLVSNLDPAQVAATAQSFVDSASDWQKMIASIQANTASYSLDFSNQKYETMAARPGGSKSVIPTVFKVDRRVSVGYMLTLHLRDGTVRSLRIICRFQPVGFFPHLPRITPTPGCTHNCTPNRVCTLKPPSIGYSVNPVTCTLYKNGDNTYSCQQNGGPNCPPNGGVQNGTTGTKGGTPGAGPRPSPLPVVPKPSPGQPNPSPNSSGYDSGGGTNSAPNGGSCDASGCTSQPDPTTSPTDTGQGGDNSSPAPGGPG